MLIVLVEITALVDAAGTPTVLCFSSGRGYNHPSAPGFYDPRVVQPANFERHVFDGGRTGGRSTTGAGELRLANADGALDTCKDFGFDGQRLAVRIGDDQGPYETFTTLLVGTMEQAEFTWTELVLRIRDRQAELDRPVQTHLFAGTNAGSPLAGIEGRQGDIKGSPKPLCYGAVFRVPAIPVNTEKLIFQVHDGPIEDVPAAYDNGVLLTKGADYASQSDMEANAPAVGTYRVWQAGGCFRLGSAPTGTISADVRGDASGAGYISTMADIMRRIVVDKAGIADGDIVEGDLAALNAANSSTIGIWVSEPKTVAEVLDELAASVGAWWGFDRLGRFRVVRLAAPSGAPAIVLKRLDGITAAGAGDGDIIELERVASHDPGRGLPVWRVALDYLKAYTSVSFQTGGASPTERAFVAREFRTATASDVSVKTQHALATTLQVTSLLTEEGDALAEAARLLALYKVKREMLRVRVRLDVALAGAVDLGAIVELRMPRFGWTDGKLFLVIGMTYQAAGRRDPPGDGFAATLDLTLWG